ncbi:hypothetical protein MUK42_02292 [Musa troglodytarum]|uniref:Uncharacterized protein n=1 Tax=Musa troglodytarum TaxID=320322 RepID=A0A9E7GE93_9LILI|nr:hypothetical protein MUK42_02292 [Musa troglodytarum]
MSQLQNAAQDNQLQLYLLTVAKLFVTIKNNNTFLMQ